MSLADLPHEIVVVILRTALDGAAVPGDILCVCSLFRDLGADHLYTHLRFTSAHQLHQFALSKAPRPPIAPCSLAVDLTGKAPQRDVFRHLSDALVKCRQLASVAERTISHGERDVRLKHLRLRMHAYARDSGVDVLERGLQAVRHRDVVHTYSEPEFIDDVTCASPLKSPDTFEWTGPDPDHHFSTAIVPLVASCLFKQFSSWCNIRKIIVTNISFATNSDPQGPFPPLMGDIPSLRTLYIGQATFLHPQAVAGMFCQGIMARLTVIRLVDAYSESIWGPRLRRSDIENAVKMLCSTGEQMAMIARVKRVVTCEKKTERIMGGDRVEGTHILD